MEDQLVPIGRFATATRLSIKALRHYDDIGLLSPARVDPSSGYRYYRLGQANRAEAVRILRGLDMPLDDVAELLDRLDQPDQVHKLLDDHRRRLADELVRHEQMLAFLERLLTNEEHLMPYTIHLEDVPTRRIASRTLHTTQSQLKEQIGPTFGQLVWAVGAAGTAIAGPPMLVFHDVIDDEDPGAVEVALHVIDDAPLGPLADDVGIAELRGGSMAATLHIGPYDQITPAYHALTNWMAEHGHDAAGPPREIYLDDPNEVAPADLRTRIEWPVA